MRIYKRRFLKPPTLLVFVLVCLVFYIYWVRFYYTLFDIPVHTDIKAGENLILNPNFEEKALYSARYWRTSDKVVFSDSAGVYRSRAACLIPDSRKGYYLKQSIVGNLRKGIYVLNGESSDSGALGALGIHLKLKKGLFKREEIRGSVNDISRKGKWFLFKSTIKIPQNYTRLLLSVDYQGKDTLLLDNLTLRFVSRIDTHSPIVR